LRGRIDTSTSVALAASVTSWLQGHEVDDLHLDDLHLDVLHDALGGGAADGILLQQVTQLVTVD